jgi:outer membrane lipoprotein-sorting protein
MIQRLALTLFSLVWLLAGVPAAAAESLSDVLSRMDKAAAAFQSMSASLTQLDHIDVINENETQKATVKLRRSKAGLVGRVDFSGPNTKVVAVELRKVQVYYPKSNVVDVYDVGKFGDQLDQFLLLGFGTSGKELEKNYKVRLVGAENVGGHPTWHLELIPKSKQALDIFKKADVWIAQDANYPVQEKIHKNEQDYTLITYSDVKLNPPLSDKDLELVLPPGVKKITPQR